MYVKNKGLICSDCGEAPAQTKGLCRRCYSRHAYARKTNRIQSRDEKAKQAFDTASIYADIARRAKDGETYQDIGLSYNVSRQNIEQLLRRLAFSSDMRMSHRDSVRG